MKNLQSKILSLISIIFAICTLYTLSPLLSYMNATIHGCINGSLIYPSSKNYIHLGVPLLDQLNCFVVPFFKDAIKEKATGLFTGVLGGLFVSFFVFGSLESLDKNRNFFIRCVPIWTALSQIAGVSVAVPLFWIPAFWMKDISGSEKTQGNKMDFGSLRFISIGAILFILSLLSIDTFTDSYTVSWCITIFNVSPVLIPLLWMIPRLAVPDTRAEAGPRFIYAKIFVLYFFAGICTFWYYFTWIEFIRAGSPFYKLRAMFTGPVSGPLNASLFLVFDCLSLLTSMFLFDFVENRFSIIKMLRFALFSMVFSPGSAFLFSVLAREKLKLVSIKNK